MILLRSLLGVEALWTVQLLVTRLLQIAVLMAVAHFILLIGRRRYAVDAWTFTLVAVLTMPMLGALVPRMTLELRAPVPVERLDNPVSIGGLQRRLLVALKSEHPQGWIQPTGAPAGPGPGFAAWLGACWFIGSLLLLSRLIARVALAERLRRESRPVTNSELLQAFERARSFMGITIPVSLRESSRITGACSFGWLRPVVILPTGGTLESGLIAPVLRHELAHLQRRDWLRLLVAEVACVLYWFHPLVWAAARHQELAMELAADRIAVVDESDRQQYAAGLLALAAGPGEFSVTAPWRSRRFRDLRLRLRALALPADDSSSARNRQPWWLMLAAAAIILSSVSATLACSS